MRPESSGNEDDVSPDDIGNDVAADVCMGDGRDVPDDIGDGVAADVCMGGGRERDVDTSLLELVQYVTSSAGLRIQS